MSWIGRIPYKVERYTYFVGKLHGKFIGYLDPALSDGKHENVYNLEILEATISANKEDFIHHGNGFPKMFMDVEETEIKFSQPMKLKVTSEDRQTIRMFDSVVQEPKLIKIQFSKQTIEGRQMFGTIDGEFSGYLIHFETEFREIEIHEPEIDESVFQKINHNPNLETSPIGNPDSSPEQKTKQKTFWSRDDWDFSWIQWIFAILGLLLLGVFFLQVLLNHAPVLFILGALGLIVYLVGRYGNQIGKMVSWIFPFLGSAFFLWMLWSFLNGVGRVSHTDISPMPIPNPTPSPKPRVDPPEIPDSPENSDQDKDPRNPAYRFNELKWSDYSGTEYSGTVKIPLIEYQNARNHKQGFQRHFGNQIAYSFMLNDIYQYDNKHIGFLYSFFDSLQSVHQLSREGFAEMVVTCVQEMQYVLVLNQDCNPSYYSDRFIRKFLREGGKCLGNESYGILTPVEFITTLEGDCDTRALLLATVLKHYGIDAVVLSSEVYGHAILGVDLNYRGQYKQYQGKRYIVWETTAKDVQPGIISPEMRNMRAWEVNILSE